MRAILINAETREIKEIDLAEGYMAINEALGCRCFTMIGGLPNGHDLLLDDEGLLCGPKYFYKIKGYGAPLATCGLILASTEEGESVAASLTVEEVKSLITFLTLAEARAMARCE